MELMKIAIVWQEIPETSQTFVADVTAEDWESISKAHGCYINTDSVNEHVERLNTMIEEGRFQEHSDEKGPLQLAGIEHLVVSGFVL